MEYKSGETKGVIAFSKPGQPYRFAKTSEGDVFIPPSVVSSSAKDLASGTRVELVYHTGDRGFVADKISICAPEPLAYTGEIKFFDTQRGFGFIHQCEALPGDVFLHASVCMRDGVVPADGMKLQFNAVELDGKYRAVEIRQVLDKSARKKSSSKKTSAVKSVQRAA